MSDERLQKLVSQVTPVYGEILDEWLAQPQVFGNISDEYMAYHWLLESADTAEEILKWRGEKRQSP